MKFSAWIVLVYAFIVFLGGIMGYVQAQSLPSLFAGIASATVLFVCAWGMFKRSFLAYSLAMVLILALTLFFGYRFALTGKFMPAGMMILVSAITLTVVFLQRKKKTIHI